jgi:FMN reductase
LSALRLVGIAGNTRRPSRTRSLVEAVGAEVGRWRASRFEVFDLVDAGPGLGAFTRAELPSDARKVLAAIEEADALVVGSPVYKGSYTGLFKHLFDFVGQYDLVGKPVLLAATGGGEKHALIIEHQLRPLFAFFQALTLPVGVYASNTDFDGYEITSDVLHARIALAAERALPLVGYAASRPVELLVS